MVASPMHQKWQGARSIAGRVLGAIYVGGAYGLILISLVQAMVLFSWLQH